MILSPRGLRAGTSNLLQLVLYGHVADLRPMPAEPVGDVPPGAIRAVSRDAGGQPVQLVGWCLGGILALLAAADPDLPVAATGETGLSGRRDGRIRAAALQGADQP